MTRILLVTTGSARDVKTWSGTSFHIYNELVNRFQNVDLMEDGFVEKAIAFFRRVFLRFGIDLYRERIISRIYALFIKRYVIFSNPDFIVSVASSHKISMLKVGVPVIHVSDATFAAMRDYYPRNFRSLKARSLAEGEAMEQRVLDNCDVALLSSEWAASSAREHYGLSHDKARVAQFGANVPTTTKLATSDAKSLDHVDLLFIGVEWERKGGDLAFEVLQQLRKKGILCTLQVVGCQPPANVSSDKQVVCHGFLNKHDPAQAGKIDRLFQTASFLIVPSRQEAYGLVFAEAAAYSLPSLATRTGGVPSVVEDNVTGFLFALDAPASHFVDAILQLRSSPERYQKMRSDAREFYELNLTWKAWSSKLLRAVEDLRAL